jgi:endoglucanase
MVNYDLLKRLCETPGIPSREERMRTLVSTELKPLVNSISVDAMGNVVGHRKGKGGPRVMLAAHMDEIGFIVRFIDDKGFIRIQPVGGFDARVLIAQRVRVHTRNGQSLRGTMMPSTKPIHLQNPEDANKPPKLEDLFVDLGLSVEKVKESVELGDMITLDRTFEHVGDRVVSKSLDNRLSIFVMIEALKLLKDQTCEVFAVATTQEEIGLRGVTSAAFALEPNIGIALDITLANDMPGMTESDYITKLGAGCAIKIMDSSLLCHPKLVRHFRDIAEREKIPHQLEVLPRGGTDAGGIQRSRGGVPSFTLSVPTRYVHTVNEMAAKADIEAAITLLAKYIEEAHTRDYGYSGDLAK